MKHVIRILYAILGIMWGIVIAYKFGIVEDPTLFAIIITIWIIGLDLLIHEKR